MGFNGARLEASAISCPRALFRFFTRSFGHSVHTSCHTNCCPKTNWFPYSYFRWRKGCYFRFRVLANHLASFFFLHPVKRFIRTTICPYTPFFIHPVTECKHLLAFILIWICYFGREELTYIPYSSFNGQSLAAC